MTTSHKKKGFPNGNPHRARPNPNPPSSQTLGLRWASVAVGHGWTQIAKPAQEHRDELLDQFFWLIFPNALGRQQA